MEITEDLKKEIDSAVKAAFAPFAKIVEQKQDDKKDETDDNLDGVSDGVKQWLKSKSDDKFSGRKVEVERKGAPNVNKSKNNNDTTFQGKDI